MLDTVRVTFDDGNVTVTDFNAEVSREEMARYYYGHLFTAAGSESRMHKAVKVEFPLFGTDGGKA